MRFADVWGPDWLTVTLGDTTVPLGATGTIAVRHGRQRVDDKPAASTIQVTLAADGLPRLPRIGDAFSVQLGDDATAALGMTPAQALKARSRFVGRVTDAVDAPGAAGLVGGGFVTITAAGRRADLGRVDVDEADNLVPAAPVWSTINAAFDPGPPARFTAAAVGDVWAYYIYAAAAPHVGKVVTFTTSVRAGATPRNARAYINFYTPAGVYMSQVASAVVPDVVGAATGLTVSGVVPPGTGRIGVFVSWTAAAAAEVHYIETADLAVTSWPAELDGARAWHILMAAAAAAGLTVGTIDPGAFTVLARDMTGNPAKALALLDKLADDTGGVLVQLRDGTLTWQDRNHRRLGPPVAVVLRAGNIIRGVQWIQSVNGLVNDLTVSYGVDPQATVREVDDASGDVFGPMVATLNTELALEVDAADLAHDVISRRSRPAWRIEALAVDLLRTVDGPTSVQLLGLEVSDLLGITGFPESGPHVATRLFVEGWTETISAKGWRLALAVSDYGLSGESPRWVDVTPDLTWAAVDPEMTWLQAAGWSLAFAEGRWWDVPADQTWAAVDPAATWSTYTIDAT